jgi:hypothetical protein
MQRESVLIYFTLDLEEIIVRWAYLVTDSIFSAVYTVLCKWWFSLFSMVMSRFDLFSFGVFSLCFIWLVIIISFMSLFWKNQWEVEFIDLDSDWWW